MALTLALYSGPDRPSSPSVPPPAPVSASAPVSSPLSIVSAVPLSSLASSPPAKSSLSQSRPFSSPPTSPKGIFIHHNPEESNADQSATLNQSGVVSPRRSVNKALAPLTTSSVISPPRTHPVSPPTRASVSAPLIAPVAPIAHVAPVAPISSSSPPLANPSMLNSAPKAASPPLTALPVVDAAINNGSNARVSNDALRASSAVLGPEHQEWFTFLIECGIPIGSAPRYALWLVKEGVEVEHSRYIH